MIKLQSNDGECISIDVDSPIYNSDLLISFRDYDFDNVVNLNYSMKTIKNIHNKNKKSYKNIPSCVEICHMCDFVGLHNNYTLNAFDYLAVYLSKNIDTDILLENPHFVDYMIKYHPELYLLYDIEGEHKNEVKANPDRYITPVMAQLANLETFEKYVKADNLKMVMHISEKCNWTRPQCFAKACKYGAYNIIKHLTRKNKIKPSDRHYIDTFTYGNLSCCTYFINIYKPCFKIEWLQITLDKDNLHILKFLYTYYKLKINGWRVTDDENKTYSYNRDFAIRCNINCYEFIRNLSDENKICRTSITPSTIGDEDKILKFLQFDEFYIIGYYDYIINRDYLEVVKLLIKNGTYIPSSVMYIIRTIMRENNKGPPKICEFMSSTYPDLYEKFIGKK